MYDITCRFDNRFLTRVDRTRDQMLQAARPGKKNIIEGSKAGRTSRETEITRTHVARASLEELLDDDLDILRARVSRRGGAAGCDGQRDGRHGKNGEGDGRVTRSRGINP